MKEKKERKDKKKERKYKKKVRKHENKERSWGRVPSLCFDRWDSSCRHYLFPVADFLTNSTDEKQKPILNLLLVFFFKTKFRLLSQLFWSRYESDNYIHVKNRNSNNAK
jgi:hypothetical protein